MIRTAPGREWLAGLEPAGPVTVDQAAGTAANTGDAVARIGAGPVCWAIEVGREMALQIIAEIPAFGGGEAPFEVLRQGTEASIVRALLLLADPGSGLPSSAEESLAGVREFVQRGISLGGLLRGIRLGHEGMARAFLAACEERVDRARLPEEMAATTNELFRYVDGFADSMTQEYLAEYDRWATSAAAARAQTVRALLAGDAVDAAEASRVLGYDLGRTHLGLTAWTERPGADSALQLAAAELLRARGATATLVVPVGSGLVWAWGVVAGSPGPAAHPRDDVRAAFGLPGAGVAGFRRTHGEAGRAERLRRLAGDVRAGSSDYADVAVAALLAADLTGARDFVRRELGALVEPSAEDLRTTLLQYLEAERSVAAVAAALHIARGTVTYRVRRAEQILGRDVGERRLALHTALLLADELGHTVLDG
ncbi:helix-turn-helix domain-containing protein [Pseudonocardia ailaonensis]|uniref:Helix-turn-helix domain-containing protein n=1 Tax=Pseudonocardia ailaonensis TaxID=367279 RepID=A0ABN2N043_9PSEU